MAFSGHHARKRFGQHWLKDESVLQRIVAAAALRPDDHVLEVGPGRGALTAQLLASPVASVQAVELDRDLVEGLQQRFGAEPRFQLQSGDVLALPQLGDGSAVPPRWWPTFRTTSPGLCWSVWWVAWTARLTLRISGWCCWFSRRWPAASVLGPGRAVSVL